MNREIKEKKDKNTKKNDGKTSIPADLPKTIILLILNYLAVHNVQEDFTMLISNIPP